MNIVNNPDNKPVSENQIQAILDNKMSLFEVTGLEGDIKHMWDPNDPNDVEEARREFERLTKEKKYRAFRVTDSGDRGEIMKSFEPVQGRVIFVSPIVGG